MTDALESTSPGRPRDPEIDRSILDAARELLLEGGYRAVTMEGVARRAGVGKTTVYRRWRSKPLLVYDAFFSRGRSSMTRASGSLAHDLRALIDREISLYRTPGGLEAVMGLLSDFSSHPEIEATIRERFFRPDRREALAALVESAKAEGRSPDLPLDLVIDAFTGALFVRSTLQKKPIDDAYAERLLHLMLEGIDPTRSSDDGDDGGDKDGDGDPDPDASQAAAENDDR